MLFKTYPGIAEYEEDHHSYRCNFFTVINNSYGHSPVSTASGLTISVLVVGVLESRKTNAVYNEGFDFQYGHICSSNVFWIFQ